MRTTRGRVYHFSIQGRTVCQGPMHLVCVHWRNSDGDARKGRGLGSRKCKETEAAWSGEGRTHAGHAVPGPRPHFPQSPGAEQLAPY